MLFINNKYESLQSILEHTNVVNEVEVADEEISNKGFTKLKKAIQSDPKADVLSDDDQEIDNYKNTVIKYGVNKALSKYDNFFTAHNIESAKKYILEVFSENNDYDELEQIFKVGYKFTIDQLLSKSGGNLYDDADLCGNFKKSAMKIARNEGISGGIATGKCELLLRMMLDGGRAPSSDESGDVKVGNDSLEVKATSKTSFAHPSVPKTQKEEAVYTIIDEEFTAKGVKLDYKPGKCNYASDSGIKVFNDNLKQYFKKKSGGKFGDLAKAVCEGIKVQYNSKGTPEAYNSISQVIREYENNFTSGNFDKNTFRRMIGRMQVVVYASDYHYFIAINYVSGHFIIVDSTNIANIIEMSDKLTYSGFGELNDRAGAGFAYR